MRRSLIIGLDIGTTNVKAAAFHGDGERLAEASQTYPTYYPHTSWAEQSPSDWQEAIKVTLKQLLARLGDHGDQVAALGLSAHAPGLIPVDSRGNPLIERIPIWQDERSLQQGKRLLEEIGSGWVGLGMPFAAFPAKLKWFTETHPDLAREAQYALGVKAYLLHWLTGCYGTDPSSEPGKRESWQKTYNACDWSMDRLAPVLPATKLVGEVRDDLSKELGFEDAVPVVMGLNDGASATLGNGAVQPGEGVITLATNGVIFLVSDKPIPSELRLKHALFCWPYVDDHWIVGGQTKTGAASLQWLHGLLKSETSVGFDIEQMLLECANTPPGSHGVMFFPYLMGRGTPKDDPSVRGGFIGLTLQTNRADLTRAVLEGVAFTLRDVFDTLTRNDLDVNRLMITGGGAQSELWRQIVADVLNKTLSYSDGDSCLGAAILAAIGVGIFPSIEAALKIMKSETQDNHPRHKVVAIYEQMYDEYVQKRDALLASN
jgi:xylulokinase